MAAPDRTASPSAREARAPGSPDAVLGDARASVVRQINQHGDRSAPELAQDLGCSDVAVRRHLSSLEEEGLVTSRTVNQGRGRPVARYRLTEEARSLFAQGHATLANELIEFITDEQGREGFRRYLRWRLEREASDLGEEVTADSLRGRLEQLAEALSEAGYDAAVSEDGEGFRLVQRHCAVYDVAKHHPEMCAYEAASFRRVLGEDVNLSRRQTLAGGGHACVCTVRRRGAGEHRPRVARSARQRDPT